MKRKNRRRSNLNHEHIGERFSHALRRYFFTGLAALFPIVLTIFIFLWLVHWLDERLRIVSRIAFGVEVPGLGIVVTFCVIVTVGFVTVHLFGRVLFRTLEMWFTRLPIFRQIYPALKQLGGFLFKDEGEKESNFKRAVLIEYPRPGCWALGFVTHEAITSVTGTKRKMVSVLVPQPPSPVTGPIIFVPEEDVIPLDMPIPDAVKLVMSGGVVSAPLQAARQS